MVPYPMRRFVWLGWIAGLTLWGLLFFLGHPAALAQEGPVLPAAAGSIRGQVLTADGALLSDIEVLLYHYTSPSVLRTTVTDAAGSYTFGALLPGAYRLEARDPAGVYGFQYYGQTAFFAEATQVVVAGDNVVDIDIALAPASAVSGTISASGGYTFTRLVAVLYRPAGDGTWAIYATQPVTAPANYSFGGLAGGSYRVCAFGYQALGPFLLEAVSLAECYVDRIPHGPSYIGDLNPSLFLPLDANDIAVSTGQHVQDIHLVLGDISQLQGRVSAGDGQPLAGIRVLAEQRSFGVRHEAWTDAEGRYRFGYLSPGAYFLSFVDSKHHYAPEYYPNVGSEFQAHEVVVNALSRRAIDTILSIGARLSGTIRLEENGPPPNLVLQLATQPPNDYGLLQYVYPATTEPSHPSAGALRYDPSTGAYEVTGIPPGRYGVYAYANLGGPFFVSGFYGGAGELNAKPVSLEAGQLTPNVDVVLAPGGLNGSISGRVLAGGRPQANIEVGLFYSFSPPSIPQLPFVYTYTDAQGHYRIDGLPSSYYQIGFRDRAGLYATTYYTQSTTLAQAALVEVRDGVVISNVNVNLELGGGIEGTVRQLGEGPLANYRLLLYALSSNLWSPTTQSWRLYHYVDVRSDAQGHYKVMGLPPGRYRVGFLAPGEPLLGFLPDCPDVQQCPLTPLRFAPHGGSIGGAREITVTAGQVVQGVDLVLDPLKVHLPIIANRPLLDIIEPIPPVPIPAPPVP